MAEPNVYGLADRFRAALLRQERAAATEMVQTYGTAWRRIRGELTVLLDQAAQARAAGEEVSATWLFEANRLTTLQRQIEAELRVFGRIASDRIIAEQSLAVTAAQRDGTELLGAGLGPVPPGVAVNFAGLPTGATVDLMGFLQDGSPLRAHLDTMAGAASQRVRESLVSGFILGQGPASIARTIQHDLGGTLAQALTIARTETLRAYRESSRRVYQANEDVLEGWEWSARLETRTCAFCWSMHGTVHSVRERFASHPNCRCSPVPRTKTWAALGFPGVGTPRPERPSGVDAFADLPRAEQRAILGPSKYAAYRDGALTLEDLRGFRDDPRWGPVGYERSLRDVLGVQMATGFTLQAMRA